MKISRNIKNLIIVILCITIICMGIGFALLSMKLDSKNKELVVFDLSFIRVIEGTPVKGGNTDPVSAANIINQGKTLDMHLTLNNPYDEVSYVATIRNEGTVSAEIVTLIEKVDSSIAPVEISYNEISGKVLDPKEEIELRIVAVYKNSNNSLIKSKSFSCQYTIVAKTPDDSN